MEFELFDRDAVAGRKQCDAAMPTVRVDQARRLLFNPQAWSLLALAGSASMAEVLLMFDREARIVGVQPVGVNLLAEGVRWPIRTMRSLKWPRGVPAEEFVDHYQVADGEYQARLLRGPGPRMVTFEVGAPRFMPSGVPPGSLVEEEPLPGGAGGAVP